MGTFSGSANLVYDPELKTNSEDGSVYCRLRLANQERRYDKETKKWVREEPLYFTMTVYKQLAKNLAQSVIAGDRLIVVGKFRIDKYIDKKTGDEREDLKLIPHEVGVDLRFHAAVVEKDDEPAIEEDPF